MTDFARFDQRGYRTVAAREGYRDWVASYESTVEDAMERLYFLAKVEKGLEEAEAGKTVSHEEAKRRILG